MRRVVKKANGGAPWVVRGEKKEREGQERYHNALPQIWLKFSSGLRHEEGRFALGGADLEIRGCVMEIYRRCSSPPAKLPEALACSYPCLPQQSRPNTGRSLRQKGRNDSMCGL